MPQVPEPQNPDPKLSDRFGSKVLAGHGIAAIGLHLPPLALPVEELAQLRGASPAKYTVGLGCAEMALCPPDHTVVDMAVNAAERALKRWGGDRGQIGLLAVGTESALDMSRPLSAWVAERLGLKGAVRSYEVKHACYGGTLAVRQALEWRLSGLAGDKVGLVIAVDTALYEQGNPGEPTQGAGAVAMVIGEPRVATIETTSYPWSEPEFDFCRPVGEDYPRVDGELSLDCYSRAAEHCFLALVGEGDPAEAMSQLDAVCFHVPFPKMVKKAWLRVGGAFGWHENLAEAFYKRRIEPFMTWNRLSGNAYTASLWISVAQALSEVDEGARLAAFSYGSGFGAELLTLTAGPAVALGSWTKDVDTDLRSRRRIEAEEYVALRA